MDHTHDTDARARRTKVALHEAFSELVLEQRYDEFGVRSIVERADVGRSTFYEHFRGKDELLLASMGFLLDALASAASPAPDGERLRFVVEHFQENRELARYLLAGPPAERLVPRIVRELAGRLEPHLAARGASPVLPPPLAARQIAEAQLGLLRAWTAGPREATAGSRAPEVATALLRTTRALVDALAEERPDSASHPSPIPDRKRR